MGSWTYRYNGLCLPLTHYEKHHRSDQGGSSRARGQDRTKPQALGPRVEIQDLLYMDEEKFSQRFGDKPVSRVKRIGFIRNLLICQRNLNIPLTNTQLSDFLNANSSEVLKATVRWVQNNTTKK